MAEENNLPVVNAIDELKGTTSASNSKLLGSISSGLSSAVNSIRRMETTLSTLASAQLRSTQEQMQLDALQHQESINSTTGKQKGSLADWLQTFISFQNKQANDRTRDLVDKQDKAQMGMMRMFKVMGETLGAMNRKLSDIAASTMHTLDYFLRQERNSLALAKHTGRMGGSKDGRSMGLPKSPYDQSKEFVGPKELGDYLKYTGAVSIQETQNAIARMARSVGLTLKRQDGPSVSPSDPRIVELRSAFNDTLRTLGMQMEDLGDSVQTETKSREKTEKGERENRFYWKGIYKRQQTLIDKFEQGNQNTSKFYEKITGWLKKKKNEWDESAGPLSGLLNLFGIGPGAGKGVLPWAAGGAVKLSWRMLVWAATALAGIPGMQVIAASALAAAGVMWLASQNTISKDPGERKKQLEDEIKTDLKDATEGAFNWLPGAVSQNLDAATRELMEKRLVESGMSPGDANRFIGAKGGDTDYGPAHEFAGVEGSGYEYDPESEGVKKYVQMYEEARKDIERRYVEDQLNIIRKNTSLTEQQRRAWIENLQKEYQHAFEQLKADAPDVSTTKSQDGKPINERSSSAAAGGGLTMINGGGNNSGNFTQVGSNNQSTEYNQGGQNPGTDDVPVRDGNYKPS